MRTIIIKNLSTTSDECVVDVVGDHLRSERGGKYHSLFEKAKEIFEVEVKVVSSPVENKVTYTVTDKEPEQEGE